MVDIVIFSKDRPLQLYSTLESVLMFTKGYSSITVLFKASTEDYFESYVKLNKLSQFESITFIDESQYGFQTTLLSLLSQLTSQAIVMETDDTVYCSFIDFSSYTKYLDSSCGRVNYTADYRIYDQKLLQDLGDCLMFSRVAETQGNQAMCLNYPFNVSSTIHKIDDVIALLSDELITNPFELEWKGCAFSRFTQYNVNCIIKNDGPIVRQMHINNFLNRYEQHMSIRDMYDKFAHGFVFDLDYAKIKNSDQNLEWFHGKDLSEKFPIFPWDVDPNQYINVISYKKLIE